tara:strand:+ start:375 stop:554 length:180 start_codon:yes stop_codon:yes gene_type:complete
MAFYSYSGGKNGSACNEKCFLKEMFTHVGYPPSYENLNKLVGDRITPVFMRKKLPVSLC